MHLSAAIAVLVGGAAYAFLLVAYFRWLRAVGGTLADSLVALAGQYLPFAVSLAIGLWLYHRLVTPRPPTPLVLWLRKFHLEPGRTAFHRILQEAATGYGVTLTIRDTRFSTSLMRGLTSVIVAFPLPVVAIEVLFPVVAGFAAYMAGSLLVGVAAATLICSMPAYATWHWLRRRGVVTLPSGRAVAELSSVLQQLTRQPHRLSAGVLVIRTDDAEWQAVVRAAIRAARVVILDVGGMSANVLWEIRATFEEKPLEHVIVARSVEDGVLAVNPAWMQELGPLTATMAEVPEFTYPACTRRFDRKAYRALARRLGALLAQGIATSVEGTEHTLKYDTACAKRAMAFGAVLLVAAVIVGSSGSPGSPAVNVRGLTHSAIGAPESAVTRGRPVPDPPNNELIVTLQKVIDFEWEGRHATSSWLLRESHGDPSNPWLLLARGRAYLLNRECHCETPPVVSFSRRGEFAVNDTILSDRELFRYIEQRTPRSEKRAIVFVSWQESTTQGLMFDFMRSFSMSSRAVAVAPENLADLRHLCGALWEPPIRFR